jgi:hypothetical protein
MRVVKLEADTSNRIVPISAALPYQIIDDRDRSVSDEPIYDPISQRSVPGIYAGSSRSTYEESVGFFPWESRSDTKKDD